MSDIDTGDTVLHRPTGETWLVACVQGDRLSWCGWPEGQANLADCDLVKKATPDEKQKLLRELADMKNRDDHRCRYARHALGLILCGGNHVLQQADQLPPDAQEIPADGAVRL